MATEAQKRSSLKYDKENIKQFNVRLNKKIDKLIIDKLNKVDSMQGYIKQLILNDIEKND